jgi:signal transduction histidine kinase
MLATRDADGEVIMDTMQKNLDALRDVLIELDAKELPEDAIQTLKEARHLLEDIRTENERTRIDAHHEDQSKAKFISLVSHELRIPMTSIKGYSDLLLQGVVGPLNEQQVNFLGVIRNNVERMSTLLSNLADISKLETGRLKLDYEFFPLHLQVEQVVNHFHPKIEEKSQSLAVEIDSGLPQVYGDVARVVQIVSILVDNAYRYTPSRGKLRLSAGRSDDYIRVALEDSGIGISPLEQKMIFTQFFRSEDQAVREEQGWGLGLVLARALVEQMGGQIGFESDLGMGSTFWFTLPTYVLDPPDGALP